MSGTIRNAYKCLTIAEKMRLLHEVDERLEAKGDIAKKYGIARSSVSTILKNRQKIEMMYRSHNIMLDSRQRLKPAKNRQLERRLLQYVCHLRDNNIPTTSSAIRERALVLANQMNIANFKASNGWFNRFKKRYDIISSQFKKNYVSYIGSSSDSSSDDDSHEAILVVVKSEENDIMERLKKETEQDDEGTNEAPDKKTVFRALEVVNNHLKRMPNLPLHISSCYMTIVEHIIENYKQNSSEME